MSDWFVGVGVQILNHRNLLQEIMGKGCQTTTVGWFERLGEMQYSGENGFPPASGVIHGFTFASKTKEKARVDRATPVQ